MTRSQEKRQAGTLCVLHGYFEGKLRCPSCAQIAALPELVALARAVVRDVKPKGAYYPLYDAARAALAKAGEL
jgi:hypothetical protein